MTIGNLNLPVMTVHAEPEWSKSIENTTLGTGSIVDPKAPDSKDAPWTGSYVYYGTYGNQAAPVAKEDLKVSDTAQELVTAGKAEGGELLYALGTDDKTAPTDGWSKDLPKAKDAGIYYVWYKAVGDKNHKDTEPACVKVIIAEKAQDEKPEEVITDPVTEKQEKVSETVKEMINDVPVSAYLAVSYPMAVEWTGKKVTKAQLEALLNEGESLAKLNISGLEDALKPDVFNGLRVVLFFLS